MFTHLVESATHSGESRRRGLFFLGALGFYSIAFAAIGVGGVLAYDARLDQQSLELVSVVQPVEMLPVERPPIAPASPSKPNTNSVPVPTRTSEPPSSDPTLAPKGVAVTTNQPPPVFHDGDYKLGRLNLDPGEDITGTNTGGGQPGGTKDSVKDEPPQPPASDSRAPNRKPITVSKGAVQGFAKFLPQPAYSPIARAAGIQGTVVVEILIDEKGNVISARAVSGPTLLHPEALKAAYRAKFNPTTLSGVPVRVSGVINYNFLRN
jgi:periplasmic protein TonB